MVPLRPYGAPSRRAFAADSPAPLRAREEAPHPLVGAGSHLAKSSASCQARITRRFVPATVMERHCDFGRVLDGLVDLCIPYTHGETAGVIYEHYVACQVHNSFRELLDPEFALAHLAIHVDSSPSQLACKLYGRVLATLA